MSSIPSSRPSQLVAGDTWRWTRDLADYPAGTWTLTYYFQNANASFEIVASALGSLHSINQAASATADLKPGRYQVTARASSGGIVETIAVEAGPLEVLPNPASTGNRDGRSPARRIADALLALIEERATTDQQSVVVSQYSTSRMSKAELRIEWERWNATAKAEERKAARLAGREVGSNRLQVRF